MGNIKEASFHLFLLLFLTYTIVVVIYSRHCMKKGDSFVVFFWQEKDYYLGPAGVEESLVALIYRPRFYAENKDDLWSFASAVL